MNYLETLLTQAQYEVKKLREQNEPTEFAKGFHEGYQACERFYTQPNPYLPEGCKGSEKPEQWITEYRRKASRCDNWKRSEDSGLRNVFTSREEAQAAVDKDEPNCSNIVRRVRRID